MRHYFEAYQGQHLSKGQNAPVDLFDRRGRLMLSKGGLVDSAVVAAEKRRELYVVRSTARTGASLRDLRVLPATELDRAETLLKRLIAALDPQGPVAGLLAKIKNFDADIFRHCFNVGVLSALIASEVCKDATTVEKTAMAGLLHDAGKILIRKDLLDKPGPLTPGEYLEVQNHSPLGADLLAAAGVEPEIVEAVRQHHERVGGGGYPYGLAGGGLSCGAMIVSIADVFDAITSDRPYRLALPPHYALDVLIKGRSDTFEPAILDVFLARMDLYPEGALLVLNTGEMATVAEARKDRPTRPVVRLFGREGQEGPDLVDLQGDPDRFISYIQMNGDLPMRMMLVDDEHDCLQILAEALEPTGHAIETYTRPDAALAAFNAMRADYSVVITDLKMPGMSGIDLLREMRKTDPAARVIIITGYGDTDSAIAAVNNGAFAFFSKPIDFTQLIDKIEQAQREEEAERARREEHRRLNAEYERLNHAFKNLAATFGIGNGK